MVGLASTGNVLTVSDGAMFTSPGVVIANDAGSGGTVNIGAGGAAGSFDAPVLFGAGTGVLNFNHTHAAYLFDDAIAGPGEVRHVGGGTTTLAGPSTYTGGTTVSAGTLRQGAAGGFPPGEPVVLNGGVLDVNNFSTSLGELVLQASSTLHLGSANAANTVTFASAAPWVGGTLLVAGVNFQQDQLVITADPTATGILDHIQFVGYPVGATWNPQNGVVLPRFQRNAQPAPALSGVAAVLAILLLVALAAPSLRRRPGTAR